MTTLGVQRLAGSLPPATGNLPTAGDRFGTIVAEKGDAAPSILAQSVQGRPIAGLPRFANAAVYLDSGRRTGTSPLDPTALRRAVQESMEKSEGQRPPFIVRSEGRPYAGAPLARIDVLAGARIDGGDLYVSGRPGSRSEWLDTVDNMVKAFREANLVNPDGILVLTPPPSERPEPTTSLERAIGAAARRTGMNLGIDLGALGVLIGKTDGTVVLDREAANVPGRRFERN